MTYDEKITAYQKLVGEINNCPKLNDCNSSKSINAIQLEKCSFCNEVNLWSYWQGGINSLNADILLVGQDWGNFRDSKCEELVRSIKSLNGTSYTVFPMAHCGVFGTNNRKDTKTGCYGIEQIKKDWKRVKAYL